MSQPDDVLDLLTLQMTPGLGEQRISALLGRFATPAEVLRANSAELASVDGIGPKTAAAIRDAQPRRDALAELDRATKAGVCLVARGTPKYPMWLAEVGGPYILFTRGEILPTDERAVGVVGTRHPTHSGKRIAQQLAQGLARAGVVVVSGLARGVDGIAHRAALEAGGRTIAVLAGGLSRIYPPEHADLAGQVEKAGALVTESTMDQEPLKGLFPQRNRIISGLSRLVVIVQAGLESGALITAEHAAEQGRMVMAVPGAVEDKQHEGCNKIIRDGAILCRGVDDILEELDGVSAVVQKQRESTGEQVRPMPAAPVGPPPGLDEPQRRVWEFLANGPRAIDEISQHLGIAVSQLSVVLMALQFRKLVAQMPGNRYQRV